MDRCIVFSMEAISENITGEMSCIRDVQQKQRLVKTRTTCVYVCIHTYIYIYILTYIYIDIYKCYIYEVHANMHHNCTHCIFLCALKYLLPCQEGALHCCVRSSCLTPVFWPGFTTLLFSQAHGYSGIWWWVLLWRGGHLQLFTGKKCSASSWGR